MTQPPQTKCHTRLRLSSRSHAAVHLYMATTELPSSLQLLTELVWRHSKPLYSNLACQTTTHWAP
jgi:hypothetical protein